MVPKFHEMMRPVLEVLSDGTERRNPYIQEQVAQMLNLTEDQRKEVIPSGKQPTYKNRTNWAITYLINAGLVDKLGRGIFRISSLGKDALKTAPEVIDKNYLIRFESFQKFSGKPVEEYIETQKSSSNDDETPEAQIPKAMKIINNNLSNQLLSEIAVQTPSFFETLVVQLLVAMGYGGPEEDSAQIVGQTGDDGIDGIIKSDKLGFDRIYVQAKRYAPQNAVGNREIRNFSGALVQKGANKGVFITTSAFTPKAVKAVEEIKTQKIVLIDGDKLTKLMIEYNIGVSVKDSYIVKRIDMDYFSDEVV